MNALGVPAGVIAAMTLAALVMILAPPLAALWARRRLDVGWRHFFLGAATFLVFQLLTRIPLVTVAGLWLAEPLAESEAFQWLWLLVLAFSAGLFEETGRYVCFRWMMRREEKTWDRAVMVGLGHGGLESMLLVGASVAATLVTVLLLPAEVIETLPPEAREGLASLAEQPAWTPLLGAAERLMSLVFHVALSVMVVQAFLRGGLRWLLVAIVAHGLGNALVVGTLRLAGDGSMAALAAEGTMAVITLLAVAWLVHTARRQRPAATTP